MRLRTAVLLCVLVGCSSSTKQAATTTTAATSTTSSQPSDPCVAGPSLQLPAWPVSGALRGINITDVGTAAAQFATAELRDSHAEVVSTFDAGASDCSVKLSIDGQDSVVGFVRDESGSYVVNGLLAGSYLGGSLQVSGRHVEAHIATECTDCATWEMHIRYGDVTASVRAGPSPDMAVDLPGDPAVEGAYVFIERDAAGAVLHASCTQIPPGDFAAS